jgi:hypothetical protein
VHGDSGFESSFPNQFHGGLVVISIGVGKMLHRKTEPILQLFFAREDFFFGLIP